MTNDHPHSAGPGQPISATRHLDSTQLKWAYDSLWEKAQEFAFRADALSPDAPEFPLWSAFALEMLARATLAHVHPSLLAAQGDENILYACGCTDVDNPRSIPVTHVLRRCQAVLPNFNGKHYAIAKSLIDRRNEELHSGGTPFDDFPTKVWLADYFVVCKILLDFQQKTLASLFGEKQANTADAMISAKAEQVRAAVAERIAAHRTIFGSWDEDKRNTQYAAAEEAKRSIASHRCGQATCPACATQCYITGETVHATQPRIDEDNHIVFNVSVLPTSLKCHVCGLELVGHAALDAANLGGVFTYTEVEEPLEYYESEIQQYMQDLASEREYGEYC